MELERKEVKNTVVLAFQDSTILDDTNAQKFKNKLIATLAEGKHVLLNMGKLNLISSSGMGALVAISALANERKVFFGLCNLSGNLMNLFKVTKLYMIFKIFQTEDEAIDAFSIE
jgi:anti-sigma B factor antagonist